MFSYIISILFPPTQDEKKILTTDFLIPEIHIRTSPKGVKILSCASYTDPLVHAVICTIKKYNHKKASFLLAQLLSDILLEEIAQEEIWSTDTIAIVPMPQSRRRLRERGYNQIESVLRQLPPMLQKRIQTNILAQSTYIPMQKTLTRVERFKNVQNIFTVHNIPIGKMRVFLIDDVTTTGATLEEAVLTLEKEGIQVTAIALARA